MNNNNKNSAAKIKANNKYSSAHYMGLSVRVKPDDYNTIDSYCTDNNISKAQFIVRSCKYIIDNNIDITDNATDSKIQD